MSQPADLKSVLSFLRGLRVHNNRAWFEKNRPAYEAAKAEFEAFVDGLIGVFGESESLGSLRAKDCVSRIYRDIRFSADKSPYRTDMSAHIAPGGRKSSRLGYYLHLAPEGGTMVAGGLYMPEADQLAKFRRAVERSAPRLKRIAAAPDFKRYFRALEGEKLKTAPKGYPADHAEIDLLRFKQILVVHHVSDTLVMSAKFPAHVVKVCRPMKPFLEYLNEALDA